MVFIWVTALVPIGWRDSICCKSLRAAKQEEGCGQRAVARGGRLRRARARAGRDAGQHPGPCARHGPGSVPHAHVERACGAPQSVRRGDLSWMSASLSWLCGRLSVCSDWNQLGTHLMYNSASLDVSLGGPALSIVELPAFAFPPAPRFNRPCLLSGRTWFTAVMDLFLLFFHDGRDHGWIYSC